MQFSHRYPQRSTVGFNGDNTAKPRQAPPSTAKPHQVLSNTSSFHYLITSLVNNQYILTSNYLQITNYRSISSQSFPDKISTINDKTATLPPLFLSTLLFTPTLTHHHLLHPSPSQLLPYFLCRSSSQKLPSTSLNLLSHHSTS